MIQTLPCPGCHRTLVLAAEVSLQAVLRCRHCSHQFVLGEMAETEMGFWEVIDDPNAPEPKVFGTIDDAADDAELELAKSDEYLSPQMLIKNQAEKKDVDRSKFEPITHEQYERMRRKGKSPIWSMLSVLLGGLASIPIATLLIWHVLGKDPLQMGPVVGRYAPWIVPARFQPFEADNRREAPPARASGFRRFGSIVDSGSSDSPEPRTEWSSDSDPSVVSEPSNTSTGWKSPPPRNPDRSAPPSFSAHSDSAIEVLPENEETVDRVSHQQKPRNDVFTNINQVKKDLEAWNERGEDRELRKKLALQTYSNLASLALAIDELPAASPLKRLVRTELHSVGQQIAQHTDMQQLIQSGSRFWISSHQDGAVGLAIVINVASTSELDNAWQITPATAVGDESMQITVPKEIMASFSQGQNVLAIGRLSRMKADGNSETSESTANPDSVFTASYIQVLEPNE